jgi:glycolate oxidase FAD binding subunit
VPDAIAEAKTPLDLPALATVVGRAHARPAVSENSIDSVAPGCVVQPDSADQVAAVVRLCAERKWAVCPRGGGTKLDLGNTPARVDVVLSTARLKAVRWYTPRDMTISVEAGMQLADLQTQLGKEGQRLPVNPPHVDECTVGGVIAADSSGFLRFSCGTVRDSMIGIEFVTPEGVIAKAGSKVVKNVAGYDLMKLHTGAFGRLGVITAVNFKLRPTPPARGLLVAPTAGKTEAVVAGLLTGETRPAFVEYLATAGEGRRDLFVGYEHESESAIAWQIEKAVSYVKSAAGVEAAIKTAGDYDAAFAELTEDVRGRAVFKAVCPSARAVEMIEFALSRLPGSGPFSWTVQGSVANGVFYGAPVRGIAEELPHWSEAIGVEPLAAALAEVRARCVELGGGVVLQHAPVALKRAVGVWGPRRGDWGMMEKIAAAFDPAGIMNPGRMV